MEALEIIMVVAIAALSWGSGWYFGRANEMGK